MSLARPHPLWTTAGSSPYETNKTCVQAKMLSWRFRTEKLCHFWSANPNVFCLAPSCKNEVEGLEHILTSCPSLAESRMRLRATWLTKAASTPFLHQLLVTILSSSPELFCMFVLDSQHIQKWLPLTRYMVIGSWKKPSTWLATPSTNRNWRSWAGLILALI